MALTTLNGYTRLTLSSIPEQIAASANNTLDATGEYVAQVGRVMLSTGPGTSKTISGSGGGSLHYRCQTLTLANAGTDISFGIQDVDATTGLPDGTFDVEAVINTGNPITTTIGVQAVMTTGSKTIAHGDVIAIVMEMTTRGGTDSMIIVGNSSSTQGFTSNYPYRVTNVSGSPVKNGNGPALFSIIFDDGTVGWISRAEAYPNSNSANNTGFTNASTPNERGFLFSVPFKCKLEGIDILLNISAGATFNLNLYSDPTGTPVEMVSLACDPEITANAQGMYTAIFDSEQTLEANTDYLIALEPTSANTSYIYYRSLVSTGNNIFRKMFNFPSEYYTRTMSGNPAFSASTNYYVGTFALLISQIDDGASTGGGEVSHVF